MLWRITADVVAALRVPSCRLCWLVSWLNCMENQDPEEIEPRISEDSKTEALTGYSGSFFPFHILLTYNMPLSNRRGWILNFHCVHRRFSMRNLWAGHPMPGTLAWFLLTRKLKKSTRGQVTMRAVK